MGPAAAEARDHPRATAAHRKGVVIGSVVSARGGPLEVRGSRHCAGDGTQPTGAGACWSLKAQRQGSIGAHFRLVQGDPEENPPIEGAPSSAHNRSISVVVPVFGDGANLDDLTRRVALVLDRSGVTWELVLVNDGSPA